MPKEKLSVKAQALDLIDKLFHGGSINAKESLLLEQAVRKPSKD